jgi:hypothetical protein
MDKMVAVMPKITDDEAALKAIYAIFDVVVLYFFVCAGGMLLLLAIMYWFGKTSKTKYEFGEMINRTIIGFVIPVVGVTATLTNKTVTGFKFVASDWLIPIVLLGYLIVVVLDNTILTVAYLTNKHRRKSDRWSGGTYVRSPDGEDDDDDHVNLVNDSKFDFPTVARERPSSAYSRNTAYQPYDAYAAQPGAQGSQQGTPEIGGGHSRGPSRSTTPQPPQIPVSMIMQNNFRPSHARTRSAGYAAVNNEEHEEYDEAGHGFVDHNAEHGVSH